MATWFTGDVVTDIKANQFSNPRVTQPDRSDVDDFGVFDLIDDDALAPEPGNIKSNFYGWFERLQMSVGAGLSLSYDAAKIRRTNGQPVVVSSGTLVLPANTSVYVYADDTPAIVSAPTLPNVCAPLAWVTTDASSIIAIEDIRDQACESVRVVSLPSVQSPWVAGDSKESHRATPEPGWLLEDGRSLSRLDYPVLFAAIGYRHGGSGNNFNLPDSRGRVFTGAGQAPGLGNYVLGAKGGAETVTLNTNQMPAHVHGVNEEEHTHGIDQAPHSHDKIDPGHVHPSLYKRGVIAGIIAGDNGAELTQANATPNVYGAIMESAQTNIQYLPARANLTLAPRKTNVSIQSSGGNAPHENRQPYIVGNRFIRCI